MFILINVYVINIKLLISIMNQINIIFDRVRGIIDEKIIIGIMQKLKNKLIVNLFFLVLLTNVS